MYTWHNGLIQWHNGLISPRIAHRLEEDTYQYNTIHSITESTFQKLQEMQIKTTGRYHHTPIKIAILKRADNTKYWQGCGETQNLYMLQVGI